jgi:hypothetical protein
MSQPPDVVTYDGLPAAAGGAHSLRTKRPAQALDRVSTFLDACTTPIDPPRWGFQVAAGGTPDETERIVAAATDALGGPRQRSRTHTTWNVRPDTVDAALAVVDGAGAAATTYGGALAALTLSVAVDLIDPADGAPYAGMGAGTYGGFAVDGYGRLLGQSGVRATVGTSASSLSLWLNLPGDSRLEAGARHVQDNLSFKLSGKHWRRWAPTRAGDGWRSVKETSPLSGGDA